MSGEIESKEDEEMEQDADELWFITECVFCKKNLTTQSEVNVTKLLQCLHSVCNGCVNSWNENEDKICPVCLIPSKKLEIRENKVLCEIVSENEIPDIDGKVCNIHDAPVSHWCIDCAEFICEDCVKSHGQLKSTRDHVIKTKEEHINSITVGEPKHVFPCSLHPENQLTIVCHTCHAMTCRDCQLELHRDHKYDFVSDKIDDTKKEVYKFFQKIEYHSIVLSSALDKISVREKKLEELKIKLISQIKDVFDLIIDLTRKRCKELMLSAVSKTNEKLAECNIGKAELEKDLNSLKLCLTFVKTVLYKSSDPVIFYTKDLMMSHMDRIRTKSRVPNAMDVINLRFVPTNLQELKKGIWNVGKLDEMADTSELDKSGYWKNVFSTLMNTYSDQLGINTGIKQQHQQQMWQQILQFYSQTTGLSDSIEDQKQEFQQQKLLQQKKILEQQLLQQQQQRRQDLQQQQQRHEQQQQQQQRLEQQQQRNDQQQQQRNEQQQKQQQQLAHDQFKSKQQLQQQNQISIKLENPPPPVSQHQHQMQQQQQQQLQQQHIQQMKLQLQNSVHHQQQQQQAHQQQQQVHQQQQQAHQQQQQAHQQQQQQQAHQQQQLSTAHQQLWQHFRQDQMSPPHQGKGILSPGLPNSVSPVNQNPNPLANKPQVVLLPMGAQRTNMSGSVVQNRGGQQSQQQGVIMSSCQQSGRVPPQVQHLQNQSQQQQLLQQQQQRQLGAGVGSPHQQGSVMANGLHQRILSQSPLQQQQQQQLQLAVHQRVMAPPSMNSHHMRNNYLRAHQHAAMQQQIHQHLADQQQLSSPTNLQSPPLRTQLTPNVSLHRAGVVGAGGRGRLPSDRVPPLHQEQRGGGIAHPGDQQPQQFHQSPQQPRPPPPAYSFQLWHIPETVPLRPSGEPPPSPVDNIKKVKISNPQATDSSTTPNNYDIPVSHIKPSPSPLHHQQLLSEKTSESQKRRPDTNLIPTPPATICKKEVLSEEIRYEDVLSSLNELNRSLDRVDIANERPSTEDREDSHEDWCAACMDGGDLVCCDVCPKAFHHDCHIPKITSEEAKGDWQCLLCKPVDPVGSNTSLNSLSSSERNAACRLLLEIYCQYDASLHLRHPVSPQNTRYYEIVRQPICLDQIRDKLANSRYKSMVEFVSDVKLMFNNYYQYHAADNTASAQIKSLEELFTSLLSRFLSEPTQSLASIKTEAMET